MAQDKGISPSRNAPQSVGRIFAILDALASAGGTMSLAELAVAAEAPKTSLVGLLTGLVAEGALVRGEGGRYVLGPRVLSLAMRVAGGEELVKLARPVMERLCEQTGETVVFGTLAPGADLAHYLDRVESTSSIRYAVTIGERRELYCSSMGKILLAFMPEERREQFFQSVKRIQFTGQTITDEQKLRAEIATIRRIGLARSSDERIIGASGIGAPIFGNDGSVVAGLVVAGPTDRFLRRRETHETLLIAAAAECTKLAGGQISAA